jgi:hypothetical protein
MEIAATWAGMADGKGLARGLKNCDAAGDAILHPASCPPLVMGAGGEEGDGLRTRVLEHRSGIVAPAGPAVGDGPHLNETHFAWPGQRPESGHCPACRTKRGTTSRRD